MTTFMQLSEKENDKMPNRPVPHWKQYVTPGMLSAITIGGIPYIESMQSKLADARESNIRLEEKVSHLSKDVEAIRSTLELIRSRLESRGIVHRTENVVGEVAGEKHTSK